MLEQACLASGWLNLGLASIQDGTSLLLGKADLGHLGQGTLVGFLLDLWVLKDGHLVSDVTEVGLKAWAILIVELGSFAGVEGLSLSLGLLLGVCLNAGYCVFNAGLGSLSHRWFDGLLSLHLLGFLLGLLSLFGLECWAATCLTLFSFQQNGCGILLELGLEPGVLPCLIKLVGNLCLRGGAPLCFEQVGGRHVLHKGLDRDRQGVCELRKLLHLTAGIRQQVRVTQHVFELTLDLSAIYSLQDELFLLLGGCLLVHDRSHGRVRSEGLVDLLEAQVANTLRQLTLGHRACRCVFRSSLAFTARRSIFSFSLRSLAVRAVGELLDQAASQGTDNELLRHTLARGLVA